MQPSLIRKKDCQLRKFHSWVNGLAQTGYLRTSAIPNMDGIDIYADQTPICIDAIDFNQHIGFSQIDKIVRSSKFLLSDTLAVVDFGLQRVDVQLLDVLLGWFDRHAVTIKQLNLSNLSVCSASWNLLFKWMKTTVCQIDSIDLGKMKMRLDAVKDLAAELTRDGAMIHRLDFGYSRWTFCEMKAFLWAGCVSSKSALTRLALGDARFCQNSLRLLCSYVFQSSSGIQVFSSGVVDLPEGELSLLLNHAQTVDSSLQSIVLSHQSFSQDSTKLLGSFIENAHDTKHLALINCWFDLETLVGSFTKGGIDHLHIEAITAGQIQQISALFQAKGYRVAREISRHRMRLELI